MSADTLKCKGNGKLICCADGKLALSCCGLTPCAGCASAYVATVSGFGLTDGDGIDGVCDLSYFNGVYTVGTYVPGRTTTRKCCWKTDSGTGFCLYYSTLGNIWAWGLNGVRGTSDLPPADWLFPMLGPAGTIPATTPCVPLGVPLNFDNFRQFFCGTLLATPTVVFS